MLRINLYDLAKKNNIYQILVLFQLLKRKPFIYIDCENYIAFINNLKRLFISLYNCVMIWLLSLIIIETFFYSIHPKIKIIRIQRIES